MTRASFADVQLAFQVLRVAFTVTVDEAPLRARLRWLEQSAIQPEPPAATVAYEVRRRDGAYEITRAGVHADLQFHRAGVLATITPPYSARRWRRGRSARRSTPSSGRSPVSGSPSSAAPHASGRGWPSRS